MEKQRGRPPLAEDERKGHMMRVRMTNDERAMIDQAAQKDGKDTSAWARALLVAKAKKSLGN